MKDGLAALAGVGRVTGLGDKVLDDVVERAKVVLVGLAEFEKVEREDRAQFGFEVDLAPGGSRELVAVSLYECSPVSCTYDDVSDRGLEEDRLQGARWGKKSAGGDWKEGTRRADHGLQSG